MAGQGHWAGLRIFGLSSLGRRAFVVEPQARCSREAFARMGDANDTGIKGSVFLSGRFGVGGAQVEMDWVRSQLVARGITVYPAAKPKADTPRDNEIAVGVMKCDLLVFFAQTHYGQDTGNTMSSHHEFRFARQEGKPMAWINMMGEAPNHMPDEPIVRMALPGEIYKMWE